jgi:hypothetical protein
MHRPIRNVNNVNQSQVKVLNDEEIDKSGIINLAKVLCQSQD